MDKILNDYYGDGLKIQNPRHNTIIQQMNARVGAVQQMINEQYKSDIQKRIDEYNAKYAGKNKEEVDREELKKQAYQMREQLNTGSIKPMKWSEFIEMGKAPEILTKDYTPDPELSHIQLILTSESTYCGEHNTVDLGGCHICKEHKTA